MKESEVATKEEAAAIAALRAELNPMAIAEQKAAAEAAKLDDWLKKGKITAQGEHALAMKQVETA
jgi:hypothetical protein